LSKSVKWAVFNKKNIRSFWKKKNKKFAIVQHNFVGSQLVIQDNCKFTALNVKIVILQDFKIICVNRLLKLIAKQGLF